MKPSPVIRVGLISLGCAKNLVDSEVMLGALLREGMQLSAEPADADVVIVNTCGFIEAAKAESIQTILEANKLRRTGRCRALIVAGCLTQRYPKDLRDELPEVDAIVGLNEVPRMGEIVREVLAKAEQAAAGQTDAGDGVPPTTQKEPGPELYWSGPAKYVPDFGAPRVRLTPAHFAYVKIAEGCNHPCSFCSIPRIRGRHRSRSSADIVREVEMLVRGGVREINLISQDTTFYGIDLESGAAAGARAGAGGGRLPGLLRALEQIEGDFWVRLLYTHPAHWTDELIETIGASRKVCRYVDMPLQHIHDEMLRRMRRETSGEYIRDLVRRLRTGVPGIALRTTFIVGFPGETEAHFAALLAFIEEAAFERLGIFAYSQEDHTPAGAMDGQVAGRIKQQRYRRAMTLQQSVARMVQSRVVGQTLRVLVEKSLDTLPAAIAAGKQAGAGPWWQARSAADAPEIDGTVYLAGAARAGEFATAEVIEAVDYDLVGTVKARGRGFGASASHVGRRGEAPTTRYGVV